jgi:solute carrier family 13 (sodium-dependent dicarboxylate transporter), member 2/3/5
MGTNRARPWRRLVSLCASRRRLAALPPRPAWPLEGGAGPAYSPRMPEEVSDFEARVERGLKTAGLVAGPLLALAVYAANPGGHPPEARRLLAILTLTVAWWMTEALPLAATALLSTALSIATAVAPARQVLAPYADPVIFLFMGSFLLGEAFHVYGLDERVARGLLGLRVFARSPRGLLAGFGSASAAISSMLSNTATAALLTPVASGALAPVGGRAPSAPSRFESSVLLMVAYGASIGGLATLIGTPPNLLTVGMIERLGGVRVTFADWLGFGIPVAVTLLAVALLLLRVTLARGVVAGTGAVSAAAETVAEDHASDRRAGGRWTVAALLLALVLWTAPAVAGGIWGRGSAAARTLDAHLPEAGVALLCGSLLFVAPVRLRPRRFALAWDDAQRINWGVLMLFGGGLSLGSLAETTGLAKWAGEGVVRSGLADSPGGLLFVAIAAGLTLTEFASNTAAATLLVPVVIAAAKQAGFDPVAPALGCGMACSCAFVFPVSTPPNAIVFGTGRVPLTRMIRAGVLLDLASLVVLWVAVTLLRPFLPHAG